MEKFLEKSLQDLIHLLEEANAILVGEDFPAVSKEIDKAVSSLAIAKHHFIKAQKEKVVWLRKKEEESAP